MQSRQGRADRGALWLGHPDRPGAGPGREPASCWVTCWKAGVPGLGGKGASFTGGKESGLGQLPTLPTPHMLSQSRGWPRAGRQLRVSVFSHPGILGREGMSRDETQGTVWFLLSSPGVPGHRVIGTKDGAQLGVAAGQPRCVPSTAHPRGWDESGLGGSPPFLLLPRGRPVPEGGASSLGQ